MRGICFKAELLSLLLSYGFPQVFSFSFVLGKVRRDSQVVGVKFNTYMAL